MDMREDLERRRHHRQPRRGAGTHWERGDKAVQHEGPVEGCPRCAALRAEREAASCDDES